MKRVLVAMILATVATAASAETRLVHPDGWAFTAEEACVNDFYTFKKVRYNIDRTQQNYLMLVPAGGGVPEVFDFKCPRRVKGTGGGPTAEYKDAWKDSELVDDEGNVTLGSGETKVDHPSTESTDSGFDGDGPTAIED